ncbi:protein adenylyltransferase SelO [Emcibacter sp.]|uniref:protein adenylyltransferase SelO n=1 Tax=Emcibacter sp. TaxID=1979954 RepID=UPI002AA770DD|nr:YdiU family protein [Emcibacter sp.]
MINSLSFDNRFAGLGESFFAPMKARPLPDPHMVTASTSAAELLDIHPDWLNSDEALNIFSGHQVPDEAEPLSMVYAGHQFGGYSARLGDGRGILLGQVRNSKGELWDIHTKGSGKTPFSRFGDGRAVLRSCIREYLASEALHHLGIPTTRALCILGSTEPVRRETMESASVLVRLARSHIRFGSFEYFAHSKQPAELKKLADYVIDTHFPDVAEAEQPCEALLLRIATETAGMIAHWQAYGFAHGVMNTDNMSVLGETFDYGPYGFMEAFDPGYICNHTDEQGRYAFNQQPSIGFWNLRALAYAMKDLLSGELTEQLLETYQTRFFEEYDRLMNKKLGLRVQMEDDRQLMGDLLGLLQKHAIDYSIFFRKLADFTQSDDESALYAPEEAKADFREWLEAYKARLKAENSRDEERAQAMKRANPKYILRNYLAQQAIEKAEAGDASEVEKLIGILSHPYDEQPEHEDYAAEPPEWGKHLEISCSS